MFKPNVNSDFQCYIYFQSINLSNYVGNTVDEKSLLSKGKLI